MVFCITLTDKYHLLESMETRSKEEIVIRVTNDPKEVTIYPASESTLPENVEEIVHIDTVEDGTQDRPLSDSISHGEHVRILANPPDVSHLIHIYKDYQPDKDDGETSFDDLLEHETMLDKVEGLGHVHHAGEDLGPVPQEVVNGLDSCPGTHRSRSTCLICKLKFVHSERLPKEE